MTGGRSKRRKTTSGAAAVSGSAALEKPDSPSRPPVEGMLMAASSVAPGVDLYAQARKALSERCPFDSEEAVPRFGTLPSALAVVNLYKKSDGRRKHRKVQEGSAGKSVGPGRPFPIFNVWEKSEEYFRPVTLDDIDLLVTRPPPDSCFYLSGSDKLPEELVKDEAVLDENTAGELGVDSSSVIIKAEADNAEIEVSQLMQTDEEATCSTALPVEEPHTGDLISLSCLLGCKQRFLPASGRRSRNKKLLGKVTGLEQLLLLPHAGAAAVRSPLCDFCCSGGSDIKSNRLIFCESCKVSVHQKCYGVIEVPAGGWLCSWCKYMEALGTKSQRNASDTDPSSRPCLLCSKSGGALKHVAGNLDGNEEKKFVHLFCCLWLPRVYVRDMGVMEPVMNIESLLEHRRKLVCNLCKVKHGICVRCSHGTCRTSFHPICAREAKYQMEIWGKFGHDNVELRIFCIKHSPVHDTVTITSRENSNRISENEMVEKLLPSSMSFRKLPKIKIAKKGKDEQTLLALRTESGDVQSNKTDGILPENESALRSTSEVLTILRKIIDRRKINISDVALELGVSSASLESSMMGDDTCLPSELRSKVIQWLQNFAHVQPSTCLKSRSGGVISSGSFIARVGGSSAFLNGRITGGTSGLPEVTDTTSLMSQPSCSIKNNRHDLNSDNSVSSCGVVFNQNNSNQKIGEVILSSCMNDMVADTNGSVSGNIEGRHLTELDVAEMNSEHVNCIIHSNVYSEPLHEDYDKQGSDLEEDPGYSCLVGGNNQLFDAGITQLKNDSQERPGYGASLAGNLNNQCRHIELPSRSCIHPFILKKLRELQCQWNVLERRGDIETCCYDKYITTGTRSVEDCLSNAGKLDQLEKAKNMKILDVSPSDEVEGELLYLQNCLLYRVTSIKRSCEELIYRIINHLPQELDALRRKSWDMVLVNQYLCEVKEAKKRGRKERRHTEAQAVLAAATAAAAATRTSALRKDANDGVGSSQQNPPRNSTASRRVAVHFPPVPRPKETISRSSFSKISSDKYSGDFKYPDFAKENALFCDICWRTETIVNRIFVCSSCKVAVHLDCYRRLKDPTGPWQCELCEDSSFQCASPRNQQLSSSEKSYSRSVCSLCGGISGAFRKVTDGEWVHAFCAEWLLESTYKKGQQNLVGGMDSISKEKNVTTCCICHNRFGLCLKCSYGHCQSKFHPICARNAGLFLNIKAIGGRFQHKAYCEKHSLEQKEKVDSQHGVDELRSIKQVRVDLEKLRLLCERIIKREKLKRELVVCSHGILASRRDCVAFSAMVRSSFTPGISSESATTSIDNPSYSGAMQRSDDITFDSTVHGRDFSRLQLDADRKADDSSLFQLSNRRKIANRITFSSKQLPQRPAARVSSVADSGEIKLKDRKFRA